MCGDLNIFCLLGLGRQILWGVWFISLGGYKFCLAIKFCIYCFWIIFCCNLVVERICLPAKEIIYKQEVRQKVIEFSMVNGSRNTGFCFRVMWIVDYWAVYFIPCLLIYCYCNLIILLKHGLSLLWAYDAPAPGWQLSKQLYCDFLIFWTSILKLGGALQINSQLTERSKRSTYTWTQPL